MSRHRRGPLTTISNLTSYIAMRGLAVALWLVPYAWFDVGSRALAALAYPLLSGLRARYQSNLIPAFPELDARARRRLAIASLGNSIRVFLEILEHRHLKRADLAGGDRLVDEVQSVNGGILGIQGHFGNWEIAVPYVSRQGVRTAFMMKHLKNRFVDRHVHRVRSGYGGTPIYTEEPRSLFACLREGAFVGLVADQNARKEGLFVEFFGRLASTFKGPATFAYLANVPVVLLASVHVGRGRYELERRWITHEPRAEGEDRDAVILALTQRWVSELEQIIRAHPEQYLWAHRRWRTRPLDEERSQPD